MKKIFLSVLAVLIIFSGCTKKVVQPVEKNISMTADTSDLKTTPISDLKDVSLSYRLEKGKSYKYKLTSTSEDNQMIEADSIISQNLTQTLTYLMDLQVKDVDADGIMEIDINIGKVNLSATADGKKLFYETGMKLDSLDKLKYSEYEAITNNPFSARVSKYGEIEEVFRVDKISNKIIELRGMKSKVTTEQKQMLQTEITNVLVKPILAQIFRKLPDHPVSKDTSWQFELPPADFQIFQLLSTHTFKLMSFEKLGDDNLAVIDAGILAKYNINPEIKKNNITLKQPVTTAEGKIYYNITKGLVQKSKTRTSLSVELSTMAPTPKGLKKVTRKQNTVNVNILEYL